MLPTKPTRLRPRIEPLSDSPLEEGGTASLRLPPKGEGQPPPAPPRGRDVNCGVRDERCGVRDERCVV